MKYYIETNKGKMLKRLDTPVGEAGVWTWDPTEAWEFEEDDIQYTFVNPDGSHHNMDYSPKAASVVAFLKDVCRHTDISICKHDFQNISVQQGVKSNMYRDRLTQDFYDISFGRVYSAVGEYVCKPAVPLSKEFYQAVTTFMDIQPKIDLH